MVITMASFALRTPPRVAHAKSPGPTMASFPLSATTGGAHMHAWTNKRRIHTNLNLMMTSMMRKYRHQHFLAADKKIGDDFCSKHTWEQAGAEVGQTREGIINISNILSWSSSFLVVFHFGCLPYWMSYILVVFHFVRYPFWSSFIFVIFHFGLL